MRRALLAILVVVAAVTLATGLSTGAQVVTRIDAIGLIDYTVPPRWKVGDYVRYHVDGRSAMGSRDNYDLTLMIAGEEIFWGDTCFWLETWTDPAGQPGTVSATLMSYSIFRDTLAEQHLEAYRRKYVDGLDDNGNLVERLYLLSGNTARRRNMFDKPIARDVDTLGVDTVRTPLGPLAAYKVSVRQGVGAETTVGDSSSWNEDRENRMRWFSQKVPITHIAYEEIEKLVTRRSWLIGRSSDAAPTVTRDRGFATATIVAVGHGLKAKVLPEPRQRSLAQMAAARRVPPRRR